MNSDSSIAGVITKQLTTNPDSRGCLVELYRSDDMNAWFGNSKGYCPEMSYASWTNYNFIRGPHEHRWQTDYFVFVGPGLFDLYLWDNRKSSLTYEHKITLKQLGENNPTAVIVPPGVVHAYKCVSKTGGLCLNFPNKLYAGPGRLEPVDEIRWENKAKSPFELL